MKNAHKESNGIPEYIYYLEDGQDKAERAGAPITDTMLMIIAAKAMLTSEQYPRANDDWEELDAGEKIWSARKTLYRAAANKAAIKAKAASGKDQFGAANAATETASEYMNPPMGTAMDGYFDNLAATAITEKQVLEEMMRALANLTESNEILTKTNASLTHQVTVFQKAKQPGNLRNPRSGAGGGS